MTPMLVGLNWFDEVEVLAHKNERVKFRRSISYHPSNIGWASRSAVVHASEFVEVDSWPDPGNYSYCDGSDCFELVIAENGSFELTERLEPVDRCGFWPNENWLPCRIHGRASVGRGFVQLESTEGHREFFAALSPTAFCRVGFWNTSFRCEAQGYAFKPITAE